ncbi:ORF995 [White spot syndrome virus]|uniref:ORF995 n=1 Tax=White spot syndrome virus TaxID=342409 RepID=A0A2D3I715_9VIRU|nr:ORF995 [White spot syndrome virus]
MSWFIGSKESVSIARRVVSFEGLHKCPKSCCDLIFLMKEILSSFEGTKFADMAASILFFVP